MNSVAALIITRNEAQNIFDCLQCVSWADEIVVIDSFSDDETVEIARKITNNVYQRKFDNFSDQRNFGLQKIKSEWVLVVDADERITDSLKKEILEKTANTDALGFYIPRKNYFLGKWIKYCGWYPNYTLRLFKSSLRYTGLVHESIKISGKTEYIKNDMIHYTYRDIHHYIDKINQYTTLDAEAKMKSGVKVGVLYIIFRPAFEFAQKFFFKRGFMLGKAGLFLSMLSAYYQFLKYVKLWEKNNVN